MSKSKSLSKNIRQMKFMKRRQTVEQDYKEESEEESEPVSKRSKQFGSVQLRIRHEKSAAKLRTVLAFGRFSFHGFNPAVEELMEHFRRQSSAERQDDDCPDSVLNSKQDGTVDISNQQMVAHYSSVVESIANKFAKMNKNKPAGSKRLSVKNLTK